MALPHYRNISHAAVAGFDAVLRHGAPVIVRGAPTGEVLHRAVTIECPAERFPFLPERAGDPFALVAETLWVLRGRTDVAWLSHYLRRAARYSDDGLVWRGGYGARLRDWNGVDQLAEVRRLLLADAAERRAVISLFDPSRDFRASLDVPCNNWLSWLVRDGRLHLAVAIRSNDAMWGFSGVNAFEWSVLQELLAGWLGVTPGSATFFAASFHLYERDGHLDRAERIVRAFPGVTPYAFNLPSPRFTTPLEALDRRLDQWFEDEEAVRVDPDRPAPQRGDDPFLDAALRVCRLKWGAKSWTDERLEAELADGPEDDFTLAAAEKLGRDRPGLVERYAGAAGRRWFDLVAARRATPAPSAPALRQAVSRLHRRKNAMYGAAWKRRGETISILPNVARKVDRLETLQGRPAVTGDEPVLDTAVDLLVYVLKYELFLAELDRSVAGALGLAPGLAPFSDDDDLFDRRLAAAGLEAASHRSFGETVDEIVDVFDALWRGAEAGQSLDWRAERAGELRRAAADLVSLLVRDRPEAATAFILGEIAL